MRARTHAHTHTRTRQDAKRNLILPPDLGIPLSLLDVERYRVAPTGERPALDPKDAALMAVRVRMCVCTQECVDACACMCACARARMCVCVCA